MSDFDVAGATAAIENGGGLGNLMAEEGGYVAAPVGTEQASPTPTEQPAQQGQQQSATPQQQGIGWQQQTRDEQGRWTQPQQHEQQQPTPQQQPDTQQQPFTQVDPNTLPPELQPIYKSLQADYTRKTQEIAEQRREFEQLGDPSSVREAVELYSALQDPSNWPALHQELTQNLTQLGYSLPQAQQMASQQMQQAGVQSPTQQAAQGQPQQGTSPDLSVLDDPELAPVKQYIDSLAQKVNGFEQQWQQRQQMEQTERMQTALIGELQRQENLIRQGNGHYTDTDIDAIYELSSFYGGNLLEAQQRYETVIQDRLSRYMQDKGQAVSGNIPLSGGTTPTQTVATPTTPARDFEGAHAGMMEALRQRGEL